MLSGDRAPTFSGVAFLMEKMYATLIPYTVLKFSFVICEKTWDLLSFFNYCTLLVNRHMISGVTWCAMVKIAT